MTLALTYANVEKRPAAAPTQLAAIAGANAREEDHVDPIDLAQWIKDGRRGLRVIDVREGVDTGTYVIPGAVVVPLDSLSSLSASPGDQLVLYSDGGAHEAQGWGLLRMRGIRHVRVLKDGMAAWEEDELLHPVLPPAADARGQELRARIRALSLWFGGQPRLGDPTAVLALPTRKAPRPRRRNTC